MHTEAVQQRTGTRFLSSAVRMKEKDLTSADVSRIHTPTRRDGGIGRRSGLKIRRGQPLASSSLAPGTSKK